MSSNYTVSSDVDELLRKSSKAEIESYLGVSTNASDISTLQQQQGLNASQISGLNSSVVTNTSNIATNASNIATNESLMQTNTADIATNATNITTNTADIATNTASIVTTNGNVATNTANIAINTTNIAGKAPKENAIFTGTTNFNGSVDFNQGVLCDDGLGVTGDLTVSSGKIITNEIQCEGTTSGNSQPIKYDSNEHRFRDYDANPTNLMVIKKIDGYTGARVGINKDPSSSNAVALHVVAGKNSSTNVKDLGLKVTGGGVFLEKFIRVGHYTDATRASSFPTPTNGTIIYNQEHHEFQGYVGGGTGWQKFNMGAVSS